LEEEKSLVASKKMAAIMKGTREEKGHLSCPFSEEIRDRTKQEVLCV